MFRKSIFAAAFMLPFLAFSQKYLSTEADAVTTTYLDQSFTSDKTLLENIFDVEDFQFSKSILEEDGLQKKLNASQMVTVFLITDTGFTKLKKKEREALLKNKNQLDRIYSFLTIPGRVDRNTIQVEVKKNNGQAEFATLEGQTLVIKEIGDDYYLTDKKGNQSKIIGTNYYHKNGLFHIVSDLVYPASAE